MESNSVSSSKLNNEHQKQTKKLVRYSVFTRCLHWILARIALIQTIFLFLWLAERARNENEPPMHPWVIYFHAFIGLVGSTGLSAGFFPRASLYILTALQLHTSYVYAFHSRLIYSRWLRMRFALRSLSAAGVYLRMLGVGTIPSSSQSSSEPSLEYGVYALGVTLISAFSAVSGLLQLPLCLVSLDREAQLVEQSSLWPVFSQAHMGVWISGIIAILFLAASLAYSAPLLLTGTKLPTVQTAAHSTACSSLERAAHVGDQFTMAALVVLTLFHDMNVPYWMSVGSEFWLQIRLLVDSFVIVSGILVTSDLFSESRRVKLDHAKQQ